MYKKKNKDFSVRKILHEENTCWCLTSCVQGRYVSDQLSLIWGLSSLFVSIGIVSFWLTRIWLG
jgi:hypothetical protein